MPTDYFTTNTLRHAILAYIKNLYVNATDQSTPPEGKKYYGLAFSTVEIGPLGDPDARKRSAIGIVSGPEKKSDIFPIKECIFQVNIEFRITVNCDDVAPGDMAEFALGVVQQIIYDDNTLGGTVIRIDETGNEVDLVTYADRTVQGVLKTIVEYRHNFVNVFSQTPTV